MNLYDCHGGPGTTEPACGACVTCLHRVIEQQDQRIKRLEEAGDRLRKYLRIVVGPDAKGWETPHGVDIGKRIEAAITTWTKAKEAKP